MNLDQTKHRRRHPWCGSDVCMLGLVAAMPWAMVRGQIRWPPWSAKKQGWILSKTKVRFFYIRLLRDYANKYFHSVTDWIRPKLVQNTPPLPSAGFSMVLHPEACWGGLPTRIQKTNIYILEIGEFTSTPPFSRKAFGRSYLVGQVCAGTFWRELFKNYLAGTFSKNI